MVLYILNDQMGTAVIILYQVTFASVKAVYLLQYRRVFPLPSVQKICDIVLVFVVLWGVSQIVVTGLACIPLSRMWDPTVEGHCIDELCFWYIVSTISILTDVIIFVIPLPFLRNLPIQPIQKVVLTAVFGLGFL